MNGLIAAGGVAIAACRAAVVRSAGPRARAPTVETQQIGYRGLAMEQSPIPPPSPS